MYRVGSCHAATKRESLRWQWSHHLPWWQYVVDLYVIEIIITSRRLVVSRPYYTYTCEAPQWGVGFIPAPAEHNRDDRHGWKSESELKTREPTHGWKSESELKTRLNVTVFKLSCHAQENWMRPAHRAGPSHIFPSYALTTVRHDNLLSSV